MGACFNGAQDIELGGGWAMSLVTRSGHRLPTQLCDHRRRHCCLPFLMNRIQHDHRYLALGLELIVGVGRPKFERLFPKSEAFLARRYPGPRVHLLGPDLYLDVGVRENILIPAWVLGRASL